MAQQIPLTSPVSVFDSIIKAELDKQNQIKQAVVDKTQYLNDFDATMEKRDSIMGKLTGLGLDSDNAREFNEAGLTGIGSAIGGIGHMTQKLIEMLPGYAEAQAGLASLKDDPSKPLFDIPSISEVADQGKEALQGVAKEINQSQMPEYRRNMNLTTPTGDITDPSTWQMGEDPSLEGALGLLANMAGQFVPQAASLLATKGMGTAAKTGAIATVGGAQAGEGAADQVAKELGQMEDWQLRASSGLYRDLVKVMTPEEAKKQTIKAAEDAAFLGAGIVGGIGGAATGYILGPMQKALTGSFAGRTVASMGLSGLEEGAQEVAESMAGKAARNVAIDSKDSITEGTFTDFVLGAGFGSALGSVGTATDAVATAKETAAEITRRINEKTDDTDLKEAIDTGNVDALLDMSSEKYNPAKATAALYSRIQSADVSVEEKAQAKEKIIDAYQGVTAAQEVYTEELKSLLKSDESTPDEIKEVETRLEEYNKQHQAIEGFYQILTKQEAPAVAEVAQEITEGNTEAPKKLLTLLMSNPGAVSVNEIDALIKDTSNNLTDEDRDTLRVFSEAKQKQLEMQSMEGVSEDIFKGSKEYRSMFQYEQSLAVAVSTGNETRASKQLEGITGFTESRESKLAMVEQAYKDFREKGKPIQVVYDQQAGWVRSPTLLSEKQVKQNGGVHVDNRTKNLIPRIAAEASALRATQRKMELSYQIAFGKKPAANAVQPNLSRKQSDTAPGLEVALSSNPAQDGMFDAPKEGGINKQSSILDSIRSEKNANVQYYTLTTEGVGEYRASHSGSGIYIKWISDYDGRRIEYVLNENGDFVKATEINRLSGESSERAFTTKDAALRDLIARLAIISSDINVSGDIAKQATQAVIDLVNGSKTVEQVANEFALPANTNPAQVALPGEPVQAAEPGITATQEEYDEAVRVQNSSNEVDYDTASARTLELVNALAEGTKVTVANPVKTDTTADTAPESEITEAPIAEAEQVPAEKKPDAKAIKQAERAKPFRERNRIIAYFTQKQGKETDRTAQPLVKEEGFLSRIEEEGDLLAKYISTGLTEVQAKQFNTFRSYADSWSDVLDDLLGDLKPEFYYRNPIHFLKDGAGKLPENVKSALSFAAFNFIAEKGTGNAYTKYSDVNELLGKSEDAPLTPEERILVTAGTNEKLVIQSLGKATYQALGFKADKDAPINDEARLIASLGIHALGLLYQQGLVEQVKVPSSLFAKKGDGAKGTTTPVSYNDKESTQTFTRIMREWDEGKAGDVVIGVEEIATVSKGTKGMLSRLFGAEPGLKRPSFIPLEGVQKFAKGTRQKVSSIQKRILEKEIKKEHFVKEDMVQLLGVLSPAALQTFAGVVSVDDATTHVYNRLGLRAKNEAAERELGYFQELIQEMKDLEKGLKQPLYFPRSVWKPYRVGIDTNTVNPQASKIHRPLIYMKGWETQIKFDDTEAMDNFLLAVADGLDISTDKKLNETSLKEVNARLESEPIKKAINALMSALETGSMTAEQEADLLASMDAGKHSMSALAALTAVAQRNLAKKQGKSEFTSTLIREVDGVTNGPMFTMLQLAGKLNVDDLKALVTKGGFFSKEDGYKFFTEWRSKPDSEDLYVSLATSIKNALRDSFIEAPAHRQALMRSIASIITIDRNSVKTPLTAFVFGSATYTAVMDMGNDVLQAFYDKLQKSIAANRKEEVKALLSAASTIIQAGGGKSLESNVSFNELMNNELSTAQQKAFLKGFMDGIGQDVQKVMDQEFSKLIKVRNTLNQAAKISFQLYDAAYQAARKQYVDELIKKGMLDTRTYTKKDGTSVTTPLVDLTAEQEQEVRGRVKALVPVVHTAFSHASKELDSGYMMSKKEQHLTTEGIYQTEAVFGKVEPKKGGNVPRSITASALVPEDTDPGVATVIMLIHAMDSMISSLAYEQGDALNVHDSNGLGVLDAVRGAKALNEATTNQMIDYSVPLAITEALGRSIKAFNDFTRSNPELNAEMANALSIVETGIEAFAEKNEVMLPQATLTGYYAHLKWVALDSAQKSLEVMDSLDVVNQYALEGGSHELTQEQHDRIAAKREQLKAAQASQPKQETTPEPVVEEKWGVVGTPTVAPDLELFRLLKTEKDLTIGKAIPILAHRLKLTQTGRTLGFNLALLNQLSKTVDRDTPIKLIYPNTVYEDQGSDISKARGWYSLGENGATINIKSPDFVHSGLTPELLLHEMTHAALAQAIENPNKHTRPFVNELWELRDLARTKVDQLAADKTLPEDVLAQYREALVSVHELVTWGMTNAGFQQDVLNQIQMESTNRKKGLIKGMLAFIERLTGILFAGTTKANEGALESGMSVLIANTAQLFAEANRKKPAKKANLVLKQQQGDLRLTTEQVFEALIQRSQRPAGLFDEHLKNILDTVVEKLHGPYGAFTVEAQNTAPRTVADAFLQSKVAGINPFTSKALTTLSLEPHEAFVLQQVELTMQTALEQSHVAYGELKRLYHEMARDIQPTELPAGVHSFIFKAEANANGTSDYLSRFAALAIAYPPFYSLLQSRATTVRSTSLAGMKFGQAIQELFHRAVNLLNGKLTHTFEGQTADAKLETLLRQLVNLEVKEKAAIAAQNSSSTFMTELGDKVKDLSDATRQKVDEIGQSRFFQSGNPFKKAFGNTLSIIAGDRADQILDTIEKIRNREFHERQGILAGILTETRGANDSNQMFHDLLREANKHQQERKHVIDTVAGLVKDSFHNKELSRNQKKAITRLFIRTDLAALLDTHSPREIFNLLLDSNQMKNEMAALEGQLTGPYKKFYMNQIRNLGYFMATGRTGAPNLLQNAHNIAYLANTDRTIKGTNAHADAMIPIIDRLASLYAVSYLEPKIKDQALDVLRDEMQANPEGNGIELVLRLHKKMQKDALAADFNNEPVHFIKGYTKETLNPRKEVVVAESHEVADLEAMGYKELYPLPQDPVNPTGIKHLMIIENGGLRSHVTGVVSYTGKRSKGTKAHSNIAMTSSGFVLPQSVAQNKELTKRMAARTRSLFTQDFDPETHDAPYLIPLLNTAGEAINYRYMMVDKTKDDHLDRNDEIDHIMGTLAASSLDKRNTEEINHKAILATKQQFDSEFALKPEAYIEVSAQSPDPEIRENFKLLPEATKQAIKDIWGEDKMMVRIDLYDLTFGYRKHSLSDVFLKDERTVVEDFFVTVISSDWFLGQKAALRIRQAEDIWQELVLMTKDIVVIKNLFTLLGNVQSNASLLLWMGVPVTSIIKSHRVAIQGIVSYQKDRKELTKIEMMLGSGFVTGSVADEYQQRMITLKDSLERNPVKKLVDAGLFQTIVEDVDQEDDRFTYASALTQWADKYTGWVPDRAKTVGKTLLMTHDTPLYQIMNQATSMSDFVARYTLYEHMTTRSRDPMSHEKAVQLAADAFVNYDIPSHKTLQYLNDMGFVWFTKYYLRIQKVIMHLYRDNPGKGLALITLENVFPGLSTLVDSTFYNRIENPFSLGAVKLPGAVDEILTMKLALSPIM